MGHRNLCKKGYNHYKQLETPLHNFHFYKYHVVQAFPSSQELLLNVHVHPLSGSQESVVQGLLSLQTIGDPATQLPLLQKSPVVQAFPSSQAVPLLTSINTHPE